MQTSDKKKMPDIVKTGIAVLLFVLFCVLVLAAYALPSELVKHQDFDTVVVGGSRPKWGINAAILGETSGKKVENLAVGPTLMPARYDLLEGAFEKYDLDTVILEVGFDVLAEKDIETWSIYNQSWTIPRMVTLGSKARYCISDAKIPIYEYDTVIGTELTQGLEGWESLVNGTYDEYYRLAGSGIAEANNISYTVEEAAELKSKYKINLRFQETGIRIFQEILAMCEEQGVRTIVLTAPIGDSYLWSYRGFEKFREVMLETLEGYNCEYYDFNLYKDKQRLWQDEYSYRDVTHLSAKGAEIFSRVLGNMILNKTPDEINSEELFYDTYKEAKQHSRYAD